MYSCPGCRSTAGCSLHKVGFNIPAVLAGSVCHVCSNCVALEAQLAEAMKETLAQARLNGMGSEREAALMAKLDVVQRAYEKVRAKLAAAEQALAEIQQHTSICAGNPEYRRGTSRTWNEGACDCGFRAARSAIAQIRGEGEKV